MQQIGMEHFHNDLVEIKREVTMIRRILSEEKNLDTALLSEKSLAKDWSRKEEDEAWKDL